MIASQQVTISVPAGGPLRMAANLALRVLDKLSFLAPLSTRFLIGGAFFLTGRGKWENFDRTVAFFTDLGIPFARANAAFIASLELVGGICLMLGLGTRIFSALLTCSMLVALLTADKENFVKNFPANLTDVVPVVYGLFLIWLVLAGPGWLSVDEWISRRLGLDHPGDNIKA